MRWKKMELCSLTLKCVYLFKINSMERILENVMGSQLVRNYPLL